MIRSHPRMRPDSPRLADLAGQWRSAYIHIPFCARVCPYCDFAVVAGQDDLVQRYHRAVIGEIEMSDEWGSLDAVFIGGGTPSRIPPELVGSVLEALASKFGLASDVEISMEANPEDIDATSSSAFSKAGVSRLSMGVQSFDDVVLRELGRQHTSDQAQTAVAAALAAFPRVSIDLIYGHPVETDMSWEQTLDRTQALGIDHVSAYSLTVELGTPLSRAVTDGYPAPDDDIQADRWERAAERLGERFIRYEVSNYATEEPCRYNLATWAQGEYEAFGLGAHGHRGGIRTRNLRRIDRYMEAVESGKRPLAGETVVSGWDREQERLMLGLRRAAGVITGPGGRRVLDLHPEFVKAGIVKEENGRIVVVRTLLTDTVIREVLTMPPPE
ncbi:MAG: radical SAM family heme chaperone HemW [Acidimicrobiia bacterium]|nr:radical SAM family heme chaperone HemW [Acidimicrobiia bacterium]